MSTHTLLAHHHLCYVMNVVCMMRLYTETCVMYFLCFSLNKMCKCYFDFMYSKSTIACHYLNLIYLIWNNLVSVVYNFMDKKQKFVSFMWSVIVTICLSLTKKIMFLKYVSILVAWLPSKTRPAANRNSSQLWKIIMKNKCENFFWKKTNFFVLRFNISKLFEKVLYHRVYSYLTEPI